MGLPMCHNLLKAGFPLVVYNRTAAKADELVAAGAARAPSVAALAERCHFVFACLDRVEASEEVFLGAGGVAAHARPGTIVADHGTIGPDTARHLAAGLALKGIGFLDAPVSGGPEGADRGTLTIMVGGSADHFDQAVVPMRAYGTTIVRMGEVGAGSLTKLVNQLLCFVHGAVAAEALGFGERVGLDLAALGDLMRVSFGQSRMFDRTLTRVLAGQFEAGAALRLYGKDLGLIDRAAAACGAAVPLTVAAESVLARAKAAGLAEHDIAALVHLYRPS